MYYNTGTNATEDGEFTDGNPATGVARSMLGSTWLNMMQREGLALLAAAGIEPDQDAFNQWTVAIRALIAAARDTYIPVGFLYIQAPGTSAPAELYPGTTWTQIAAGRTLVGQLNGDPDFGELGQVGGFKTHTLEKSEVPSLTVDMGTQGRVQLGPDNGEAYSGNLVGGDPWGEKHVTYSTDGGGGAHNNLPPFLVAVFWVRTT